MYKKCCGKAILLKALADPNRLGIVDMLSCGELCAGEILEKLGISQPTLSHHMKILCDCHLVKARKEGKWTFYSIDDELAKDFVAFISSLMSPHKNYVCPEARPSTIQDSCVQQITNTICIKEGNKTHE
jgi:ArsR family transcriptional regulator